MAKRKQFLLRLPEPLHDELQRWARDELRSVNAQIEYILRNAVRRHRHTDTASSEESAPTTLDTKPGTSPPSDPTTPTDVPDDNAPQSHKNDPPPHAPPEPT